MQWTIGGLQKREALQLTPREWWRYLVVKLEDKMVRWLRQRMVRDAVLDLVSRAMVWRWQKLVIALRMEEMVRVAWEASYVVAP